HGVLCIPVLTLVPAFERGSPSGSLSSLRSHRSLARRRCSRTFRTRPAKAAMARPAAAVHRAPALRVAPVAREAAPVRWPGETAAEVRAAAPVSADGAAARARPAGARGGPARAAAVAPGGPAVSPARAASPGQVAVPGQPAVP